MNALSPTKQIILTTAESLFAERGIDAVSTRQISLAAGQRNNYALQYHFGDRDTLIAAILAARAVPINSRRLELLKEIEDQQLTQHLPSLVHVLVSPMVEHAILDSQSYYLRFLAQAYAYRHGDALFFDFAPELREGFTKTVRYMRKILQALPRPLREARLSLLGGQIIQAAAQWEKNTPPDAEDRAAVLSLLAANLEDMLVGGLQARASEKALRWCSSHSDSG
jgi:AcrR family transcriptional regulator